MYNLYKGDGEHSWATLVLGIINRESDIKELDLYCMDALRAVYTGKTSIGGLGVSRQNGIMRGRGRNVSQNRIATEHLADGSGMLDGYCSIAAMKKSLSNKPLMRAITDDLLDATPKLYNQAAKDDAVDEKREMLEQLYEAHLNSRPDGKQFERYYAKPLSEMDTATLLRGRKRARTRKELEKFIDENITFNMLQSDPSKWYWQSEKHPQLILLKKWFR